MNKKRIAIFSKIEKLKQKIETKENEIADIELQIAVLKVKNMLVNDSDKYYFERESIIKANKKANSKSTKYVLGYVNTRQTFVDESCGECITIDIETHVSTNGSFHEFDAYNLSIEQQHQLIGYDKKKIKIKPISEK